MVGRVDYDIGNWKSVFDVLAVVNADLRFVPPKQLLRLSQEVPYLIAKPRFGDAAR
jgi:hypothetical protein